MNLPIDHHIPIPEKTIGEGQYLNKRKLKANSSLLLFQRMQIGDSILCKNKYEASKFQSHIICMCGKGRCRMQKQADGKVRVWRAA